jgi:vacuolar-type H+-ATPase subunit E/Vma4
LSLLELKAEIDRNTDVEISKIIESARLEAGKRVEDAKVQSDAIRDEQRKALQRNLDATAKAQLAVLRMDRKGELLKLRREWTGRVLDEAEKRITKLAEEGGSKYQEFLSNLILEGVINLKGKKFIVESNSRDLEAVKESLAKVSDQAAARGKGRVQFEARLSKIRLGGVIVSTETGSQQYNNTLGARFEAVSQNLAGEVQRLLFGAGDQNE